MDSVVISLLESIGGTAPFIALAFGGIYIALKNQNKISAKADKRSEKVESEMEAIRKELLNVKSELHKVAMFYCDKTTCPHRHPELGYHKTEY